MKPAQEIINETLRLAAEGEFATALVLLDRAVRDAIVEGKSVAILERHSGVIAEQAGDFAAVRRYYEVAVETIPDPGCIWRSEMSAAASATTTLHAPTTPLVG
jgi:hypothetical protein